MANRLQKTLADYVAIAISPVLIIALVGSLVFFLLEVLYVGQYTGRLQYILFFFVFAAVLITRISMRDDISSRAIAYGIIMAIGSALAINQFVEYPPNSPLANYRWLINLGLMGLIWWSAYKLTWDCTLIDDQADASGQGLLQVAGLDDASSRQALQAANASEEKKEEKTGVEKLTEALEEKKRPHAPGVWVVYFSLAALPLFGLGQLLIPNTEPGRRRYAFGLLCIYVAGGLGLLLTTSFLGLRRYLRQRKLQMPVAMTGLWLTVGAVLILGLLAVGSMLPRPNPEHWQPALELARIFRSDEREASKHAIKKEGAGKGEGEASSDQPGDKKAGEQAHPSGTDKSSSGESGKGKDPGKGTGDSNQKGSTKSNGTSGGRDSSGGDKGERSGGGSGKDSQSQGGTGSRQSSRDFLPALPEMGFVGSMLKWVVIAVLVLFGAYLLLRLLSGSVAWAKRWLAAVHAFWQSLFGWWKPRTAKSTLDKEPAVSLRPQPFAWFSNPFFTGAAGRYSPEDLVRYSYAALQAWAQEHNLGRRPEETPLEFTDRLEEKISALDPDAGRLADLYARITYARESVDPGGIAFLAPLWQRLTPASVSQGGRMNVVESSAKKYRR